MKAQQKSIVSGLTRRDFLQGLTASGVLLFLGCVNETTASSYPLLRPPGAQNETHFLALCLRCNKCLEICPTDVISLATLEDGMIQARTPVLNFHLGYCTFCEKCSAVCPTQAIVPEPQKKYSIGVAKILRDECIAWQWDGCTACKIACEYKAISIDEFSRPIVDTSKCNGCGKCVYICPAVKLRSIASKKMRGIAVFPHENHEAV
jgi:ferredoxin-type protein NapG